MTQPSPVSPKPESSSTLLLKTEPAPVAKESAPTSAPLKATSTGPSTKATMEPISIKPGTTPAPPNEEIKAEATSVSPAAIEFHNTALVSETNVNSETTLKKTAPKPQSAVQNVDIPIDVKAEKLDLNVTKCPEIEVFNLTAATTHSTVTESAAVPSSTVQSTMKQTELSNDDYITEIPITAKSSQQVEIQLSLQEPHLKTKPEITAPGKDRSNNLAEDVGIILSEETTKSIVKVRMCFFIFQLFFFYLNISNS